MIPRNNMKIMIGHYLAILYGWFLASELGVCHTARHAGLKKGFITFHHIQAHWALIEKFPWEENLLLLRGFPGLWCWSVCWQTDTTGRITKTSTCFEVIVYRYRFICEPWKKLKSLCLTQFKLGLGWNTWHTCTPTHASFAGPWFSIWEAVWFSIWEPYLHMHMYLTSWSYKYPSTGI